MEIKIPKLWGNKYVIARFIDEAGRTFKAKKKYEKNQFTVKIQGNEHKYLIVPEKIVYNAKGLPELFYHTNDPEPLEMRQGEIRARSVDSTTLHSIIEGDLVQDLFRGSADKTLKLTMYAAIGAAVLSLLVLLNDMGLLTLS